MPSSKMMASASPAKPDLPRQSSSDHRTGPTDSSFGSMNMDELLKSIYADPDSFPDHSGLDGGGRNGGGLSTRKTVDEVWKEIVAGDGTGGSQIQDPKMTLEDFLTRAGAVREEDVRAPTMPPPAYGVELATNASRIQVPVHMQSANHGPGGFGVDPAGFENGMASVATSGRGGLGRGKRRAAEELPLDKATQQRQRRMIKNRESAARSRERKQAYTVELESLVTQLEEENAILSREVAEQTKKWHKQLMENVIPVVEKKRSPKFLKRVNSMGW